MTTKDKRKKTVKAKPAQHEPVDKGPNKGGRKPKHKRTKPIMLKHAEAATSGGDKKPDTATQKADTEPVKAKESTSKAPEPAPAPKPAAKPVPVTSSQDTDGGAAWSGDKDESAPDPSPPAPEPSPNGEASTEPEPAPPNPFLADLPEDIFSDKMPDRTRPLDGEVDEKSYAKIPGSKGKEEPAKPAAEGEEKKDESDSKFVATQGEDPKKVVAKKDDEPELTPEERKTQAEQTVGMILMGYGKIHSLTRFFAKKDDTKLTEMHLKGEINLKKEFPLAGKTVRADQFFHTYNTTIDRAIQVDPDFEAKIRPPLERVAIKRNWLINDELYIGMLLAEDLTEKISLLVGLKLSADTILESIQNPRQEEGAPQPVSSEPPPPASGRTPTGFRIDGEITEVEEVEVKEEDRWREPENSSRATKPSAD
ncbi:MAG: hypothetical protein COA79_20245 [Planctomycetota bacterium]|nr:MAG: hypothetical protein COA79_20245 [Planctomycetota bacterium]